jgi:hypothetical protein
MMFTFCLWRVTKGSTIWSAFDTVYYTVMVLSTLRSASNFILRGILFPFKMESFSVYFCHANFPLRQTDRILPFHIPHPADVVATTPIPQPKRINCHSWRFPSASSLIPNLGLAPIPPMHPVAVLLTHLRQFVGEYAMLSLPIVCVTAPVHVVSISFLPARDFHVHLLYTVKEINGIPCTNNALRTVLVKPSSTAHHTVNIQTVPLALSSYVIRFQSPPIPPHSIR